MNFATVLIRSFGHGDTDLRGKPEGGRCVSVGLDVVACRRENVADLVVHLAGADSWLYQANAEVKSLSFGGSHNAFELGRRSSDEFRVP